MLECLSNSACNELMSILGDKCEHRSLTIGTKRMLRWSHIVTVCLFMSAISPVCVAQNRHPAMQLWVERTVETTIAVALNDKLSESDKEYILSMATLALGQVGCEKVARDMLERAGLAKGTAEAQRMLLTLGDGLSTGDFVDEALAIAQGLENKYLRETCFSLIAIRQSQRGDFGDAEKLLNSIPAPVARDRAINQICSEYLEVGRFEDASRLSIEIKDQDTLVALTKKIEKRRQRPAVSEPGYVDFQIDTARSSSWSSPSELELEFLTHYYQSEAAFELKSKTQFESELRASQLIAERLEKNDGALLRLARLAHKAGLKEEAKSFYLRLFENYMEDDEVNPFDFSKMMFGVGKDAHSEIAVECLQDGELQRSVESLMMLKSAPQIAAPLFGVVVKRKNPSWAKELYENTTDLKQRASMACSCLLEFSK